MKCEERNGSDITPFLRSDVRGTRKIKVGVVETPETGTEFQKFRRREKGGRGSKVRGDRVGRYAKRTGTRRVRLIGIVPQLHLLLRARSGRMSSVKMFDGVDCVC